MVKSLSVLAIFALLAISVIALPSFALDVKADEVAVLVKADRLEVRSSCSKQVWPDFTISCLQKLGSEASVQDAHLVTTCR